MKDNYTNVPHAPGVEHYHGSVKCYSKACSTFTINRADEIVRDTNLVQAPVPTNWRSQTDPIRNEITEKCLGADFGPESQGSQEEKYSGKRNK